MSKKILVMSDSHGHLGFISDVLKIELSKIDIIVHLGDTWFDIKPFIREIKDKGKELFFVRGNVDLARNDPTTSFINEIETFFLDNRKIFCTHGHKFEVSATLEKIKDMAIKEKSEIVLFGHTHQIFAKRIYNIFFFNPGALKDGIYGILEITSNNINYKHFKLKNIPI